MREVAKGRILITSFSCDDVNSETLLSLNDDSAESGACFPTKSWHTDLKLWSKHYSQLS